MTSSAAKTSGAGAISTTETGATSTARTHSAGGAVREGRPDLHFLNFDKKHMRKNLTLTLQMGTHGCIKFLHLQPLQNGRMTRLFFSLGLIC